MFYLYVVSVVKWFLVVLDHDKTGAGYILVEMQVEMKVNMQLKMEHNWFEGNKVMV